MIDSNSGAWTEFVWIVPLNDYLIVRCAQMEIPSDNKPTEEVSFQLKLNISVIQNAQIDFKYPGKTHYNFQPDYRNALAIGLEGG